MKRWIVNSKKTVGDNFGTSLLEVLVAMGVVSIVVLGMAGFSSVAIKGSAFSKKLTTAVTLAQDALEEVRRVGYRHELSGEVIHTDPYGSIPDEPLFERIMITTPHTPFQGLQSVTVKVAWDSGRHSTSLSTLLAE